MWWERREEDLARLAAEDGPVRVWDGETLNEIVFDLCALEGVDRVLFDLGLGVQPALLSAVARLGAGFVWNSGDAFARLPRHIRGSLEAGVYRPSPSESDGPLETVPEGCLTAVPLTGPIPGGLEALENMDLLLVLTEPVSPSSGSPAFTRLKELDRCRVRVRGVFLPWGWGYGLDAARGLLREWREIPDGEGVLVAGRGLAVAYEGETGRLDPFPTGESVLALKEAAPGWSFWSEPGPRFFAAACAVVLPVEGRRLEVLPGLASPEGRPVPERFLNARRICPVPL